MTEDDWFQEEVSMKPKPKPERLDDTTADEWFDAAIEIPPEIAETPYVLGPNDIPF